MIMTMIMWKADYSFFPPKFNLQRSLKLLKQDLEKDSVLKGVVTLNFAKRYSGEKTLSQSLWHKALINYSHKMLGSF